MRELIGWASGAVTLAALIGVGYGVAVWGFGRACLTWDCCPHAEAGT